MRAGNVLHLGVKELRSLLRDPILLALIAYAFTLAIYARATAMPEGLSRAAISIVDEDRSPLSERIGAAFYPPYFLPPVWITQDEMDARMDAGLDTFALGVPPEFQRDVLAGHGPVIQLNVDATRMSQALTGAAYIRTIVTREVYAFVERRPDNAPAPAELVVRARFNPELRRSWFGAVVELMNQISMLATILTGAALIREREHGTLEHLLVMPMTPLDIMVSKVWSMGLVVLLACSVSLTVVVQGWLGMPIEGSVPLFLAGVTVHLFAMTSMGIFLATIGRSMPQFGLLMILVMLPLQVLSGGTTPRESTPEVVQGLMLAAPTTHFVMLAQGILYRGAGLDIVWPQFVALAAIGAACFSAALARFRKTIGAVT